MKCGAPVAIDVSSTIHTDPAIKADEWFQKGISYLDGRGVEQDFKKADEAFQKALGFGKQESLSWIGIARLYQSAAILREVAETAMEKKSQPQEAAMTAQRINQKLATGAAAPMDDPLPIIQENGREVKMGNE